MDLEAKRKYKREYLREYLKLPHAYEKAKIRKARYRAEKKEILAAKQLERYYSGHEKELAKRQKYRDENREEVRRKHRLYCQAWRKQKGEELRAYMREYMKLPEQRLKAKEQKGKRRAREKGTSTGRVSFKQIVKEFNGQCGICKLPLDINDSTYHFDHIIPLAKGGSHTQDNIQIAHGSCNQSKGAKTDFVVVN